MVLEGCFFSKSWSLNEGLLGFLGKSANPCFFLDLTNVKGIALVMC